MVLIFCCRSACVLKIHGGLWFSLCKADIAGLLRLYDCTAQIVDRDMDVYTHSCLSEQPFNPEGDVKKTGDFWSLSRNIKRIYIIKPGFLSIGTSTVVKRTYQSE